MLGADVFFFGYKQAVQPLAFFDASVSTRRTGDANAGQDLLVPSSLLLVTKLKYVPDAGFESPTLTGEETSGPGYYRWTRAGLAGVDFGGKEITKYTTRSTR